MADLQTRRKQSRSKPKNVNKTLAPLASDARETAIRTAETTREWAAPRVEAAKEWAGPQVEAAKDWAGPRVEPAVAKVKEDVLPKVAGAVAAALAASEPVREEAGKRGTAAVAALRGELDPPKKKTHRLRKLFLLATVIGAAVAGWKAWTKSTSDQPEPWVAASPAPGPVSTPSVTTPLATDDPAGASPDEALADAADVPAGEVTDLPPTTEPVSGEQAAKVDEAAKSAGS